MEGLIATLLVAGLMAVALALLAKTWPRSSKLGGYRAGLRGRRDPESGDPTGEGGIPEDDDVHWRWTDEQAGQDAQDPDKGSDAGGTG